MRQAVSAIGTLITESWDVFVSYHTPQRREVERIAAALRERGLNIFFDRWYLVPGRDWRDRLEQILGATRAVAVFVGPEGLGGWQNREAHMALDRQTRDPRFSVIPVLLPGSEPPLGFLAQNTWIDLREGLDDPEALDLLIAGIKGAPPGPKLRVLADVTRATLCPYRGLRPFREEDAPYFYGRGVFTGRLIRAVDESPFVAVVGASGSGKSSVVRAGLVPYLRRTAHPSSWEIVTLLPGREPLRSLASAVIPLLEPERSETERLAEISKLQEHLGSGLVRLADVVDCLLQKQPGSDRLLFVVDQWEELYTIADGASRDRFMDQLLEATAGKASAVITLRADFSDRALSKRELAERLQQSSVLLGPMTDEELEEAVRAPAERVGLGLEPGLTKRLVNDVGQEPGNLPLLEFVLTELWAKRADEGLVHEAYDAMGGLQGALAHKAEQVFEPMKEGARAQTRSLLLQLVHRGERVETTRRRAELGELGPDALPFVELLAKERLLVTGRDPATDEITVELAHETLLRKWPRFRSWIDEDSEFLLWRERLRVHRAQWEETKRNDGALLRGAPLEEAKLKLRTRPLELSEDERDFILESERVDRAQRLGSRAFATLRSFSIFGAAVLGSGFIAEKAYRWFLGVSLEVAFHQSLDSGISLLGNLFLASLSGLALLALAVLVMAAVPWLAKRADDGLNRKGALLAVQCGVLLALVIALLATPDRLLLGSMLGSEDPAERLAVVEHARPEYDFVSRIVAHALLAVLLLEGWRRRLLARPLHRHSLFTASFVLSMTIAAVVVTFLGLLSMAHGFVYLPSQRTHELVRARVSSGGSSPRLLELIRVGASDGARSSLYCGAEASLFRVRDEDIGELVDVDRLYDLVRGQVERGDCKPSR